MGWAQLPCTQDCGQRGGCDSSGSQGWKKDVYSCWDPKHTPCFSLVSLRCRASVIALSICSHKWSSGQFLPTLTAKNQGYEIAACFVKNNGWVGEKESLKLVPSLISNSIGWQLSVLFVLLADQIAHELVSTGTAQNYPWEVVSCLAHGWGTQERSLRMKKAHGRDRSLMQGSLCRHRGCKAFGNQTGFLLFAEQFTAFTCFSLCFSSSWSFFHRGCSVFLTKILSLHSLGCWGRRRVLEVLTPIVGYHRREEWALYSCGFQPITMGFLEVMDARWMAMDAWMHAP